MTTTRGRMGALDVHVDPIMTISPVMTAVEVAIYLRLCGHDATPDEKQSAVRSVHRLVQTEQLRPLRPGREYVFWGAEVDAYIRRATESFKPRKHQVTPEQATPEL